MRFIITKPCLTFSFFMPNRCLYSMSISFISSFFCSIRLFSSTSISKLFDFGCQSFSALHLITLKPVSGSVRFTPFILL